RRDSLLDLPSFPTRRSSDLVPGTNQGPGRWTSYPNGSSHTWLSPVCWKIIAPISGFWIIGETSSPGTGAATGPRDNPKRRVTAGDRKSTRLNSSHVAISYAV